ncbi:MAG TPA: GNAT family N-acetyltransferase [Methanocella sp.]|nr:GNAT family N-acetyltransferase [Methanocella sp.]
MPSIKNPRPSIRLARLDDSAAISEVHRSHVDRWDRQIGDERFDVGYAALSVDERWGFGGPWMSVETCAVHLNHLLINRCYPFVMQEGDRVVAEMELFVQREGPPYGLNCHVGLLYVHRDFTGGGRGRAMVDHARRFARGQRCDSLTVAARPENEGFYRKCGFDYGDTLVDVEAKAQAYAVEAKPLPRPLNPQSFVWGMDMKVGRYQSSGCHINFLAERQAVSIYGETDARAGFYTVEGQPAMLAEVSHHFANVNAAFAWTHGAGTRALVLALLSWLHRSGVPSANLTVPLKDYEAVRDALDDRIVGTRRALVYPLRGGT